MDNARIAEARRRHAAGEPVKFSTDIAGFLSYGYGDLDQNGFWQYPLPFELLTAAQQQRVREEDERERKGLAA